MWDMLKAVDPTFTINSKRDFQARNAKAYEMELLVAPSRATTLGSKDRPRPVPLPEQEWLLLGRPVDQIIGCRDGCPATCTSYLYYACNFLGAWRSDTRLSYLLQASQMAAVHEKSSPPLPLPSIGLNAS
jgi:hypothetical protein